MLHWRTSAEKDIRSIIFCRFQYKSSSPFLSLVYVLNMCLNFGRFSASCSYKKRFLQKIVIKWRDDKSLVAVPNVIKVLHVWVWIKYKTSLLVVFAGLCRIQPKSQVVSSASVRTGCSPSPWHIAIAGGCQGNQEEWGDYSLNCGLRPWSLLLLVSHSVRSCPSNLVKMSLYFGGFCTSWSKLFRYIVAVSGGKSCSFYAVVNVSSPVFSLLHETTAARNNDKNEYSIH